MRSSTVSWFRAHTLVSNPSLTPYYQYDFRQIMKSLCASDFCFGFLICKRRGYCGYLLLPNKPFKLSGLKPQQSFPFLTDLIWAEIGEEFYELLRGGLNARGDLVSGSWRHLKAHSLTCLVVDAGYWLDLSWDYRLDHPHLFSPHSCFVFSQYSGWVPCARMLRERER